MKYMFLNVVLISTASLFSMDSVFTKVSPISANVSGEVRSTKREATPDRSDKKEIVKKQQEIAVLNQKVTLFENERFMVLERMRGTLQPDGSKSPTWLMFEKRIGELTNQIEMKKKELDEKKRELKDPKQ